MSAKALSITPACCYTNPIAPEAPEGPEHAEVQQHHPVPYPLQPPSNRGLPGTITEDPNAAPTTAIGQKKARTTPASPDRASALAGDIGNNRACIHARSRRRPSPGSPLRLPGKFQADRGTASAKTREGARTTTAVLVLPDPQSFWGDVERTEGAIAPPPIFFFCQKMEKPRRRRQEALRRFLTTLPAIRCNFAPDPNHAYPQGVPLDSLGSFSFIGGGEPGDTPVLLAFFERAALAIILYVL